MISKTKKALIFSVTAILFFSLMLPVSVSSQAQKPTWEEGQEWSMGFEKEIGELFSPGITNLTEQMKSQPTIEDVEVNTDGKIGYYQIFKVTEVNDNSYTMQINAGGGVHFSGDFYVKGEMPKEGTYSMDESQEKETKTIEANGEFHFTQSLEGTAKFTKDKVALKSLDLEMTMEASGEFEGNNIPNQNYDWQNETLEVSYKDYDGSVSGDVKVTFNCQFDPALDLFKFPIETKEQWTASSDMTVSGTYEGEIDAEGLPKQLEDQLESQDISLPIVLEDYETGSQQVHDGKIEENTQPVNIPIKCIGTDEVVLEDDSTTEVYLLQVGSSQYSTEYQSAQESPDPEFVLRYSPEEEFFVSGGVSGLEDDSSFSQMVSTGSMEMEPTSEDTAKEGMASIQQDGGNGLLDNLITPLNLGIIIGLIVAIIAVVLLIGIKRRSRPTRNQQYESQQYQNQYQDYSKNNEQKREY